MFNLLKAFVPDWENEHFGKFIGLTTLFTEQPKSELLNSITGKAALNGFVKALATDYVQQGIRCNAILPGTVETPSWEGRVNMADDPIKARKDFIARQAMGRLAQPEEIASMAVYLASDESDFVTGTLNLIDGGWTL